MSKKLGIITFHRAQNYGAVLQCYALQEFLLQQGFSTQVIDYHPEFPKRRNSLIEKNILLRTAKKIYIKLRDFSPRRIKWTLCFQRFRNHFLLMSNKCKVNNIPSDYDAYIIGSDQLWNLSITGGPHSVYFADFKFPKGNKKYISYAVSMELTGCTPEDSEHIKHLLENFNAISLREQNAIDFLSGITSQALIKTIDPTLLVDHSVWDNIAICPSKRDDYVLLYQVRKSRLAKNVAETIASSLGVRVVELESGLMAETKDSIKHTSPEKFVGWFKAARCVVTTSFHGTAFSLIFKKTFYSISLGDGWDNRVGSLLKDLQLQDRIVKGNELPSFSDIDYDPVSSRIENLRNHSKEFLLSNIL